jgi:hypothetical protein
VVRWLVSLGVTAAGFGVVLWIADAWGGLDRATSLSLAVAAGPLLASPFVWWASQPIEPRSGRSPARTSASWADEAGAPGAVFVCHSQADGREYAERLAAFLEDSGVAAWLDREIVSGQRWTQIIENQLDTCSAVAVVMTPAANRSEWVDREIAHARAAGKPILPLLRAGRPFFSLANVQYEDVTDGSLPGPEFMARLRTIAAVRPPAAATTLAAQPADAPTPLPTSAAVPAAPTSKRSSRMRRWPALIAVAAAAITVAAIAIATWNSGVPFWRASASPPSHPASEPAAAAASPEFTIPASAPAPSTAPTSASSRPACGHLTDRLCPGGVLLPDQYLNSPNGQYRLYMQSDGNLVLYDVVPPGALTLDHAKAVWDTASPNFPEARVLLREDGELVLQFDGRVIWSSGTAGHPGSVLRVEDNRRVAIYSPDGRRVWSRSG